MDWTTASTPNVRVKLLRLTAPKTSDIILCPNHITMEQKVGMSPTSAIETTLLKTYSPKPVRASPPDARSMSRIPTPALIAMAATTAMACPQRMKIDSPGISIQLVSHGPKAWIKGTTTLESATPRAQTSIAAPAFNATGRAIWAIASMPYPLVALPRETSPPTMPAIPLTIDGRNTAKTRTPTTNIAEPTAFSLVAPGLPIASPTILIAMMTSAMAASRLRMP